MSAASGFTPPVQRRSELTLQRMLEAAKEALDEKTLDELTLQELTARAGVTVGAFYQRFPSKAAFLHYLEEEAYRQIEERGAALFLSPPPDPAPSVREYVRTFVSGMADIYREHRMILRELVQRSRSSQERQELRMDMVRIVVGQAVDWVLAHGGDIGHPDPRKALSVALLFTSSALRDVILFGEGWAGGGSASDVDDLVQELTRAAEAYLGIADP
jgi:AcrR family transcriptional regulator